MILMVGVEETMSDLLKIHLAEDFQRRHSNIVNSMHAIRWLIRNRHRNGLHKFGAVLKRGGRWYVHEERFAEWMLNEDVEKGLANAA